VLTELQKSKTVSPEHMPADEKTPLRSYGKRVAAYMPSAIAASVILHWFNRKR